MAAVMGANAAAFSPPGRTGVAFEVTECFKSPERARVMTKARMRLEGQCEGTPVKTLFKERGPSEEGLPHLLRAAKLRETNEAKRQAAQRVGVEQAQRTRRLSEELNMKVKGAEEKRNELLQSVKQRATKHFEDVMQRSKSKEESIAEATTCMKHKLEEDIKQKGELHDANVNIRKASASEHNKQVEDKVKKALEAKEERRQSLSEKLGKKTGSKISGKVSDQDPSSLPTSPSSAA